MPLLKIFKRILLPCAAGVKAVEGTPVVEYDKCGNPINVAGTKPSDLPIYAKCPECKETASPSGPPSSVEQAVGNIRRELWVWQDNLRGYRHRIVDVYRSGFSKADYVVDYLREETHGPQRIGAIGLSGLAGYILGMRKGICRRLFYSICGAMGMAAICYPNEAADYLESVVLETRRYFIIAYHFVYGETPKMPGWLEKMTADMGLKFSKVEDNNEKEEKSIIEKQSLEDEGKKEQ